jgi:hypothetical protein
MTSNAPPLHSDTQLIAALKRGYADVLEKGLRCVLVRADWLLFVCVFLRHRTKSGRRDNVLGICWGGLRELHIFVPLVH